MALKYPFDSTGKLPSNKIQNELQSPTNGNGVDPYLILPDVAPFYGNSMVVVDDRGNTLTVGVDYYLAYHWKQGTDHTGLPVYGGIILIGENALRSVRLNYQTLGGEYTSVRSTIIKEGIVALNTTLTIDWDTAPTAFPPTAHNHELDGIKGMSELLKGLENIATALGQPNPVINISDIHDLDTDFLNPLLSAIADLAIAISNRSQPNLDYTTLINEVNVKLAAIDNFMAEPFALVNLNPTETTPGIVEIATDAETVLGDDDIRYVTPKKLKVIMDTFRDLMLTIQAENAAINTLIANTNTNVGNVVAIADNASTLASIANTRSIEALAKATAALALAELSKVVITDSISTIDSNIVASATAVKIAYERANSAMTAANNSRLIGFNWRKVTKDTLCVDKDGLLVNVTTGTGPLAITLPANPAVNDRIAIVDMLGNFRTEGITIVRNGSKIMGLDEDMNAYLSYVTFELIFASVIDGWVVTSAENAISSVINGLDNNVGYNWRPTNVDTTAINLDGLLIDTSTGALKITLPATPSIYDKVKLVDTLGTWGTNNVTVLRNGSHIAGQATDMVLSTSSKDVEFLYVDATKGWILI